MLLSIATDDAVRQNANIVKADALFCLCEYARSLHFFQKAALAAKSTSFQLRFADCALRAKDYMKAKHILEALPAHKQSIKALVMLGEVYNQMGETTAAVKCCKEILAIQPNAIEAVIALVAYGVPRKDIDSSFDTKDNHGKKLKVHNDMFLQNDAAKQKDSHSMLSDILVFVDAQYAAKRCDTLAATQKLESHSRKYNNCDPFLLSELADLHFQVGNSTNAIKIYENLQKIEPGIMHGMDKHAFLIRNGNLLQLSAYFASLK